MENSEIGGRESGVFLEDYQVWSPALMNCLALFFRIGLTFLIGHGQKYCLNLKYGEDTSKKRAITE